MGRADRTHGARRKGPETSVAYGPLWEIPTEGDGMKPIKGLAVAVAAATALTAAPAADAKRADTFEVTFTDLTSGQPW